MKGPNRRTLLVLVVALLTVVVAAAAWHANRRAVSGTDAAHAPSSEVVRADADRAAQGDPSRGTTAQTDPSPRSTTEAGAPAATDRPGQAAATPPAGEEEVEPRSLDDAPASEIAARLHEAIDRARRERNIPISAGLVDHVIDHGNVRIIVSQPDSRPALEPRLDGARHGQAYYYRHIPFVAIEVGPQALLEIVESHDVRGIEADRLHQPTLSQTVPLINADAATAAGFDGTGRVIAILDTGIDTTHPAFAGRLVDEACFSRLGDCPGGGTREFGPGTGAPCSFGCGHGTLVAGVALGLDPAGIRTGVAPDAGLISIQVFSNESGSPSAYASDTIAALEHVYDLRLFHPIAAVNMSFGGDPYDSTAACDGANVARKAAIDLLRSAGIASVAASGNDGLTGQIREPACISSAISVGATTNSDSVTGYSNSAPFLSLLAPGAAVETTSVGGGFTLTGGTSIATPHVTGAWASITEAVPGSNVAEVLFALQSSGVPVLDGRNGITTPRIDVSAAITTLDAGISIEDPVGAPGGGGIVPPPALPASACGLVGLEALMAWGVVRLAHLRRTRRLRSAARP